MHCREYNRGQQMIRELTVSRCRKPSWVAVTPQKHGYRGERALNKPLTIYSSAGVISSYDTRVRMKRLLTVQRSQQLELSKNSTCAVVSPLMELFTSYVQNYGGVYSWKPRSGSLISSRNVWTPTQAHWARTTYPQGVTQLKQRRYNTLFTAQQNGLASQCRYKRR
jgi:hypothetical protein